MMKLGAGKEMDRKCVLDWLNKVYISPSFSYSEYTDDEIRMFAHDALVLLKEQDAVEPIPFFTQTGAESPNYVICGHCKSIKAIMPKDTKQKYCHECGRPVLWEGR